MRDTYLQLSGGAEYQVSNDRRSVQYRHKPSGLTTWTHFATAPSGMEIEEIKEWHNMCIVKLDDDRWYQRSMNGHGLTLTEEEKRKDYNAQKAEKKARKAEKKSNNTNGNGDYYESLDNSRDDLILEHTQSIWDGPTREEEKIQEQIQENKLERELELKAQLMEFEDESVDELLKKEFIDKSGSDKVEIIMSFFNNHRFSERQLRRQLNKIHQGAAPSNVINKFANEFIDALKDNCDGETVLLWRDEFCKKFPFYYDNKYPELNYKYEKVSINNPFIKSGLFDIEAKMKNAKINNASSKRDSVIFDLNREIKDLKEYLIELEKYTRELLYHENELAELQKDNRTNLFGMKKNRDERNTAKYSIKIQKELIVITNKSVKNSLNEINSNISKLQKINRVLFELTNVEVFDIALKSIDGESIRIAENVANNQKRTDSNELKQLFNIQQID